MSRLVKETLVQPEDLRGFGIHVTKLESIDIGPAINPIQQLYAKNKGKQKLVTRDSQAIDGIDPNILAIMPLDIQQEYAAAMGTSATSKRVDTNGVASASRDPPVGSPGLQESLGSQVDMTVFRNLPLDIQQEIRLQHQSTTNANQITSPLIRSASQLFSTKTLDLEVMNQLPEKMQREVRAQIRLNRINKNKRQAPIVHPDLTPRPETAFPNYDWIPSRSQIDKSVYDALPFEIQDQINRELMDRAVQPALSSKKVKLDNSISYARPSLGSCSEMKDVLKVLDNWLTRPIMEYAKSPDQGVRPL